MKAKIISKHRDPRLYGLRKERKLWTEDHKKVFAAAWKKMEADLSGAQEWLKLYLEHPKLARLRIEARYDIRRYKWGELKVFVRYYNPKRLAQNEVITPEIIYDRRKVKSVTCHAISGDEMEVMGKLASDFAKKFNYRVSTKYIEPGYIYYLNYKVRPYEVASALN